MQKWNDREKISIIAQELQQILFKSIQMCKIRYFLIFR